ncbi:MAG: hypothetical protein AAF624_10165 [Bacteroidota bacterium]
MRCTLLLATLMAALVCVGPAQAQSLPDWAAPSSPPAAFDPPGSPSDPTGGGGGGPPSTPPTPVPVDGGLGLLTAAGAAYAYRRLRQRAD